MRTKFAPSQRRLQILGQWPHRCKDCLSSTAPMWLRDISKTQIEWHVFRALMCMRNCVVCRSASVSCLYHEQISFNMFRPGHCRGTLSEIVRARCSRRARRSFMATMPSGIRGSGQAHPSGKTTREDPRVLLSHLISPLLASLCFDSITSNQLGRDQVHGEGQLSCGNPRTLEWDCI
jgi:hypothetical protein